MEEKRREGFVRRAWMVVYSVGNVGYELMYEFFKNFQNFFLTDICNFSTAITGTLITAVNICKAIFTPISGMIIDKNPFRARDKHTPWIVGMPLLLGILYIFMAYLAWQGGSSTLILVVFAIFYFLPPLLQNGYRSAIPSIARNASESTFLASGTNLASNIGRMLTGIIVPFIMVHMSADGSGEDAQGFFWAVVISVVLTIIVYWVSALGVKKTIRADQVAKAVGKQVKKQSQSFMSMMRQVFTDKNIMVPFIIGLAVFFRTFVVSPTAPYYFTYITGNMLHYATLSTAPNIAGIVGTFCGPIFLAFFKDPKRICAGAVLLQIICHLSLLLIGSNTAGFIVAMTVCQFFYQLTCIILFSMFVDAVDFTELRERKAGKTDVASGTAMSLHFTAVMFAQVLGGAVRNVALAQAGYIGAETVASPELTQGLVNMYALWPTAFLAVGFIAIFFYSLDRKTMDDVHKELEPLREAAAQKAEK